MLLKLQYRGDALGFCLVAASSCGRYEVIDTTQHRTHCHQIATSSAAEKAPKEHEAWPVNDLIPSRKECAITANSTRIHGSTTSPVYRRARAISLLWQQGRCRFLAGTEGKTKKADQPFKRAEIRQWYVCPEEPLTAKAKDCGLGNTNYLSIALPWILWISRLFRLHAWKDRSRKWTNEYMREVKQEIDRVCGRPVWLTMVRLVALLLY